jgi:hypothetical protein
MDFSSRLNRRRFMKTTITAAETATLASILASCGGASSGSSNGVVTLRLSFSSRLILRSRLKERCRQLECMLIFTLWRSRGRTYLMLA